MTEKTTPSTTAPDWRVELVSTLGVRIPVVLLFGIVLYGIWDLAKLALADNAVLIKGLTDIVATCAGS